MGHSFSNILRSGVLLILLALSAQTVMGRESIKFNAKYGYGSDYCHDGVQTFAVAKEFPDEGAPLYNVRVDGGYVGLYRDVNYFGGLVHFGAFDMRQSRQTSIFISYFEEINSFEILPIHQLDLDGVEQVSPRCLRIDISKADQNITVVMNGQLKKHVLHLFINSIDQNRPQLANGNKGYQRVEEQKLIYFGKGYYDLRQMTGKPVLEVPDGWQVYLDAGAVVHGGVSMNGVKKGTKLMGHGMLYVKEQSDPSPFLASECTGFDVGKVILHTHRARLWQAIVSRCSNGEMKNTRIISTRYASTDGLDVINSSGCAFLNMFIRANDDAVAIKGLGTGLPADNPPTEHLTFCGLQLWNDCNNAFGIGAENRSCLYNDIRLMNSSVLFSYDDPDYHCQLEERGAIGICCIHGTYFKDILFDNIDVYHCERLIATGFYPSFWFGALPGDQSTEGGMENITYRDIRSLNDSGSRMANKIHLKAWTEKDTPRKEIKNLLFDNIRILGNKVDNIQHPAFSETNWEGIHNVTVK